MFSYMVGLNDAESRVHVCYLNYETVKKNIDWRLLQQMVRNDSLFVTIFTVSVHHSICRSKLCFWNVLEAMN